MIIISFCEVVFFRENFFIIYPIIYIITVKHTFIIDNQNILITFYEILEK